MTDEIKCGGEVFKSFAIRNATYDDCSAILDCLRSAFAPYRESYTPDAFLDTVLTPETLRHRLSEMSVLVATGTSGEVVGTIACKVLEGGEGHLRRMAVHPEWQEFPGSKRYPRTPQACSSRDRERRRAAGIRESQSNPRRWRYVANDLKPPHLISSVMPLVHGMRRWRYPRWDELRRWRSIC